ncbi:MAG TPA: SDR family NAD(P)-dependent oxidoreductase [Nevskia sp.]|nr:SDR family NAD(P)-dependent oxidoreductase [Nevskia sp.]
MDNNNQFEVLGLTPADAAHPGIAVALARCGGIGLLDLEFCRDEPRALANFRRLLDAAPARIGLRLTAGSAGLATKLLAQVTDERALVLLFAGPAAEQARTHAELQPSNRHRVLAEVGDAAALAALGYPHQGLVAKGHEAGGWVGADTSYILLQKLAGGTTLPIYVQGGVGVHSAAACRVLGAAGVVLDDQLLLLAESPLPEAQQNELARLNGAETRLYGELIDAPCRVYSRPGTPALKAADEDNRGAEAGALEPAQWRARLQARLGWSGGADSLMPLGQGIGVASLYRSQYRSVGRLVQALRKTSLRHIETAAQLGFMAPGGALAASHGTRYPLAQGPMTRVSDSPEFAYQVSLQGGLPFLALALMRGPQVLEMLQQTQARMGGLPWGVGMLGFVPHSLREEQCQAIWQCKPSYALIAGGRPDQAAQFEQHGIPTYIHAPAPALLKMYIEQGAKRFVFEGRECGGHIGPLASFPLWEQMVETLLAEVKPGSEAGYHLLFAGGLHDARSGAMLAALTAPLAARGMKVGGLMGTAYLFTREIVRSGAIVEGFQAQALACARTVNLESGPGHSTRCADTQFARDFYETRRGLLRDNRSADEIRDTLEELNMGRLRIASKGVNRDASGAIVAVESQQQLSDGMYMIGQVATLRDRTQGIAELHEDVSAGGQALLARHAERRAERVEAARPSDIAIVGLGTLLPRAHDADQYWHNIVDQVCALGEVPESRWDWKLYFDADRRARDKVYSRWGGFLDEVAFDPIAYGIPPKSMKVIDPMQLLTLEVTKRALADAGYASGDFDRENTSIILGASGGLGDIGTQYAVRSEIPRFVENPDESVWERLPEWSEESFAGSLINVAAGRVANRMDFGGLNFTVDAACASSLAAIAMAVHELESGRSNFAIAGGVDTVQSPFGFLCFSKTQALSPTGKPKTFDVAADGIAISEGLAVIALKRLADAERDGDRIYAVIKSVAGSSDGKALGMTAPRPEGQKRALRRAYARAGFSPATLGLVEAHGTGTPVGDRAESQTITESLLAEGAAPRSAAIGSVKTLLGHTKASAGVAGLIKVALALHHRTLPAHYGVDQPIDTIADDRSPVYLLKEARPWLAHPDHPRRGGVSAFGFGGTNFHAVLEEYRGGFGGAAPGAKRWPQELFLLRAGDEAALATEAGRLVTALRQGTSIKLRDLAYSLARQAEARRGSAVTLAIVAKDFAGLLADLEAVQAHLAGNGKPLPPGVRLGRGLKARAPQLAFLFPGQGAQYVNMGREAALYLEELRGALELADVTLRGDFAQPLSRSILPPAAFDAETEKAQAAALTDTRVAQPAIGTLALGYLRLAERLGLEPMAAAGHSYGEYAALLAAGVLSPQDFLRLSAVRGRCMAEAARDSAPGAMAAVQARREVVAEAIKPYAGVKIANHNAPEQSVISGAAAQVEQAAQQLEAAGVRVSRLPVSGAFHTELVAGAQQGLSAAIRAAELREPRFAVYSNTSGQPYPADAAGIRGTLDGHLLNSVEFVAEIEAMYAAGVRVFVELGPKGVCANMARATLAGRDAVAVSLDGQGGGLRGLLLGLAELCAAGVEMELTRLFDGREAQNLDLNRLAELVKPAELPKHTWWVSGGCARPLDDPMLRTGRLPALNLEGVSAARARTRAAQPAAASAPIVVQNPPAAPQPVLAPALPVSPALGSEALAAYQQTMRQFLSLQERVIQQFLGGAAAPAAMAAPQPVFAAPAPAMVPAAVPAQIVIATPPPPAPEAKAVVQPPAPAAAAVDRAALQAQLLGIVAERTGYPTDMLGLDQDLEAELGIDSIKRVEILGALQKLLPAAAGEAMQSGMEKFTKARSLNAILDAALALVPAGAAAAAVVVAVAVAPAPALDRGRLQAQLLGIVAERTGYPTDMLGLDQDLEAELGIDSIKRVEILGALQKLLPAAAGEAMQSGMEKFTKARSLNAILDAALALAPAAPAAVAATTIPAAAPAVAALERGALQAQLLGIVAERTGYPTDMLGLDQDLEAELGIDSIKRVEILGALQKLLPAAAGEAMQSGMEKFTKARSLNAILDAALALAPAAPAAPTAPAPAVPAPASLDRPALQSQLLGIVAERTGYPTDMLGLDQDLEAELGIDSIKRVEILGALQKLLPAAAGEAMQSGMEKFTKARSLNAILDQAMSLAAAAPAVAPAPGPAVAGAPAAAAPAAAKTPRYAPRARAVPLPQQRHAVSGLYLLGADREGVAERLADRIVGAGGHALILSAETCADAQALAAAVAQARAAGPVRGLVHLAGLEAAAGDLGGWKAQTALQAKTLFRLLQLCGPDLSAQDSVALAVSRLGGSLGRNDAGLGSPAAGAAVGLFNCAMAEWPTLRARLVDFEDSAGADFIADALLDELAVAETRSEIGYRSGDGHVEPVRTGFVHLPQAIDDHPFAPHLRPDGDWVVLVTGGARGITAEIAEELSRPGMRLVLLGRTPLPGAASAATDGTADGAALKKLLLEQALAAGRKPTPAELDREVRALLADREIRANLARLAAAGAQVEYLNCDVRDPAAFAAAIDGIYERHGRIDAVLHGAGVIEDKRIADKTAESFDRVYDTKVDSAWVLSRRLRHDSLKLLAFFTSVAGRFGNVGQGDYGAANETLNRLAWKLHHEWPGVRVVSINWGPWDAGMATDAIRAGFRSRGVEPIPVASGRRFFLDELAYGARNEVELVAGAGPWHNQAAEFTEAPAPGAAKRLPLIRQPLRIGAGGAVTLEQRLHVDDDHYLADHVMDGKPVLPAAAAMEYMGQFVAAGWPEWQVAELREVRALNGIVLEPGQGRDLVLRARASTHSEAGQQAVTIELLDPHRKLACYRASAILAPQLPQAAAARFAPLHGASTMDAGHAYRELLFHGERFRLARHIGGIGADGIDAEVVPSTPLWFLGEPGRDARWLFDPGLLDLPPQLAWVWARVHRDMGALPSRFGRVLRYGAAPQGGPLSLAMRFKPAPNELTLCYDAQLRDASGRLLLQVIDGESTMSAALNRMSPGHAAAGLSA